VEIHAGLRVMKILIEVIDAIRIERAGSANEAVDFTARYDPS
jgi:hypothetical protein